MLFTSSRRYFLKHPLQLFLTLMGIALGVAVYVGIELSTYSAKTGFVLSQQQLSGNTTHRILGSDRGVNQELFTYIKRDLGIANAAPVIQGYVALPEHGNLTFKVLGIDPFSEGDSRSYTSFFGSESTLSEISLSDFMLSPSVIISQPVADKLGLTVGDNINVRVSSQVYALDLLAIMDVDSLSQEALNNTLVMDIATAQWLLRKVGTLSQIDLVIDSADTLQDYSYHPSRYLQDQAQGDDTEHLLLTQIAERLPADHQLIDLAKDRSAELAMLESFELNLKALSLLAMLVGVFLIYNTMMFSVIQRRELYARFRTLGLTRNEVLSQVLVEAFVLGIISTIIGVLLGIGLSQFLVQLVSRTINDLFFVNEVTTLYWHWSIGLKAGLLGIIVTLVAALYPAIEASRSKPQQALQRFAIENRQRRRTGWLVIGSLVFALVGYINLTFSQSLVTDFISIFALLLSVACLVPLITRLLVPLFSLLLGKLSMTAKMGSQNIVNNLSRTVVAIAALSVAVATALSMSLMINNFRSTVDNWLSGYLKADIYISPVGVNSNKHHSLLDPDVIAKTSQLAEVKFFSRGRRIYPEITLPDNTSLDESNRTLSSELMVLQIPRTSFDAFQLKAGETESAKQAYFSRDTVIISEPYATKHQLSVNDQLLITTPDGARSFTIVGVFYDYGSQQGVVAMSHETYQKYWRDPHINSLGAYIHDDVDPKVFIDKLNVLLAGHQLNIIDRRTLHDTSLEIFDRTFAITKVLNLLVMVVAFVGIMASLMAIQMERLRENGVLRAVGFTPSQILLMVTTETLVMGIIAALIAIPLGVLLAYVLVHYVNFHAFGWTLQWQVSNTLLLHSFLLSLIAALLAGLYPAYRMQQAPPAVALRGE